MRTIYEPPEGCASSISWEAGGCDHCVILCDAGKYFLNTGRKEKPKKEFSPDLSKWTECIIDDEGNWQELTQAEVITPEEKAEFNAYCQAGESERVKWMRDLVIRDCVREIRLLVDYVESVSNLKNPTPAQVGDLNAVFEKLVNINGALKLYDDYAPG